MARPKLLRRVTAVVFAVLATAAHAQTPPTSTANVAVEICKKRCADTYAKTLSKRDDVPKSERRDYRAAADGDLRLCQRRCEEP